jgi:hypothetical protein
VARGLGVEIGGGQVLADGTVGGQQAQQQVLGADVVVAQAERCLERLLERGAAVGREVQFAQRRMVRVP